MHNSLCIFKKVRKYILRFLEIQALKRDRNHCFTPSAGIHENHLALYIYPRTEFRLPETQLSEPTKVNPIRVISNYLYPKVNILCTKSFLSFQIIVLDWPYRRNNKGLWCIHTMEFQVILEYGP